MLTNQVQNLKGVKTLSIGWALSISWENFNGFIMLQTSFQGIYRQGSAKKFHGKIGENIGNYRKMSARKKLDLKNYENNEKNRQLEKLKEMEISGEIRDICNTAFE